MNPGELSQWLWHDDSTINIVLDIIIIIIIIICFVDDARIEQEAGQLLFSL